MNSLKRNSSKQKGGLTTIVLVFTSSFLKQRRRKIVKINVSKARSEKLRKSDEKHFLKIFNVNVGLGSIRGIRMMHEFQPISHTMVQYRATSRSTHIKTFTFK